MKKNEFVSFDNNPLKSNTIKSIIEKKFCNSFIAFAIQILNSPTKLSLNIDIYKASAFLLHKYLTELQD